MSNKENRIKKEIKTRPLKQEIENLKLDIQDMQDEFNQMYDNFQSTVSILEATLPNLKGKLKYDADKRVKLLKKLYKFNYTPWVTKQKG